MLSCDWVLFRLQLVSATIILSRTFLIRCVLDVDSKVKTGKFPGLRMMEQRVALKYPVVEI